MKMDNSNKIFCLLWHTLSLVILLSPFFVVHGFSPTPTLQLGRSSTQMLTSKIRQNNFSGDERKRSNNTGVRASSYPLAATQEEDSSKIPFPLVVWRFTRPHTLIGSALAIPAIHMLAAPTVQSIFSANMLKSTLYAMVPALLMNLYITGLNQITDVEIDKINKPYLPIANGDLSLNNAKIIVALSLIGSLTLGIAHPLYGTNGLNFALWGSAILGTMYSLSPFRLKRFPILAAFCIVAVRGTVVNAGFYAHALAAAFSSTATSGTTTVLQCLSNDLKCQLSSLFFGVFGIVIALMKDVPDIEGDKHANIRTFTVRVGQKAIFHTMRRLVSLLFYSFGLGFAGGSYLAIAQNSVESSYIPAFRAGIAFVAFRFGWKARQEGKNVNAEDNKEVFSYYMYLWKLFYASYLVLPFAK